MTKVFLYRVEYRITALASSNTERIVAPSFDRAVELFRLGRPSAAIVDVMCGDEVHFIDPEIARELVRLIGTGSPTVPT